MSLRKKNDRRSKDVAKKRLQSVLVSDRVDVSPDILLEIKSRVLSTVSEFADVDVHGVEFKLHRSDDSVALFTTMPIKQLKRKR